MRPLSTLAGVALTVAALLGATATPSAASSGHADPGSTAAGGPKVSAGTVTLTPVEDSFTVAGDPTRTSGSMTKLVASRTPTMRKTAYVMFSVPQPPAGQQISSARLSTSSTRRPTGRADVHLVASTAWREATLDYANAPAVGAVVASVQPPAGATSMSFDLSGSIGRAGLVSLAVTTPDGVVVMNSKEAGATGPRLTLGLKPVPVPVTRFGVSIYVGPGDTYAGALARETAKFGTLGVMRTFYPGLPSPWPGNAGSSGGPVVVSFKALPGDILSGRDDAFFTQWFGAAPRDRSVYWTYFHEPEDDIAAGAFTAADFRAAFRHLEGLARAAANPLLLATPVLMCWTLNPLSGRSWLDYYPGADVVDVLGWDCYNRAAVGGLYSSPATLLGAAEQVSALAGKPWGVAEYGSLLAPGDDGTARAGWLSASAQYAVDHHALFVSYFDNYGGNVPNPDYRLLDPPSIAAWRAAVSRG